MGRQICFFVTEKDVEELIHYIKHNGGILVDHKLNRIDSMVHNQAFIILPNSKIYNNEFSKDEQIDQISSELIEFHLSVPVNSKLEIKNGYECGRLWIETFYYNKEAEKEFKSTEIINLYNNIKKFITKNYSLSRNKGYYIAPYALKKYLEGEFIPCSGSTIIEFS